MSGTYKPAGYTDVTPFLIVTDIHAQVRFLQKVFDATILEEKADDQGRLKSAALRIGDSTMMLSKARDGVLATHCMFYKYVEDVDDLFHRAVRAGADPIMEPRVTNHGDRNAGIEDPEGNQWWLATKVNG